MFCARYVLSDLNFFSIRREENYFTKLKIIFLMVKRVIFLNGKMGNFFNGKKMLIKKNNKWLKKFSTSGYDTKLALSPQRAIKLDTMYEATVSGSGQ